MELYIAGGCGEHGRNCFYLECEDEAWLVDCGVITGTDASKGFPRLDAGQIRKLKAVFLTHSHADHTGAVPWLLNRGYEGPVIATAPTLSQLPFSCRTAEKLESLCARTEKGYVGNLGLSWGLSGHCEGSVWLHFSVRGKSVLFTGDYTEASRIYSCDKLRNRQADLAVMDCAYGNSPQTDAECISSLEETVRKLQKENRLLFFPVPKYGRGLDLLLLLHEKMPDTAFFGDAHFCREAAKAANGGEWYQRFSGDALKCLHRDSLEQEGIVFLSDPQLRGEVGERAKELLQAGAYGIMTGTPEKGSLSAQLLADGRMTFARYPVHLNRQKCQELILRNQIGRTVLYHSPDFHYKRQIRI